MLENDTFKIVFTFDVFFIAETTMHCKVTCILYHGNRHISVSSFVYKHDQWPHDSYMTGRAGVWEADDIVQLYSPSGFFSSYSINEVNF
jgi:hypothetical protein